MTPSKTVTDPLKCGECGGTKFTLFHVAPRGAVRIGGDPQPKGHIETVCLKCSNRSVISVQATLTVEGNLCGGWRA